MLVGEVLVLGVEVDVMVVFVVVTVVLVAAVVNVVLIFAVFAIVVVLLVVGLELMVTGRNEVLLVDIRDVKVATFLAVVVIYLEGVVVILVFTGKI